MPSSSEKALSYIIAWLQPPPLQQPGWPASEEVGGGVWGTEAGSKGNHFFQVKATVSSKVTAFTPIH